MPAPDYTMATRTRPPRCTRPSYHSKGQLARRHASPAIKQLRCQAREVGDTPAVSCCWPWTHEPCRARSRRTPKWTRSEHKRAWHSSGPRGGGRCLSPRATVKQRALPAGSTRRSFIQRNVLAPGYTQCSIFHYRLQDMPGMMPN